MSVFFRRRGDPPVIFDAIFANNSWEEIIAACQSGNVPDSWAVGDSKMMTIGGTNHQIDIIGKNHDTYTAGGTAPLTFQTHDSYNTRGMNARSSNTGGWTNCNMRIVNMPYFFAQMPSEVQAGIREVNKLTSAGGYSSTINTTADKLFLLSEIEIFGYTANSVPGEGTQYAYYKAGNSKVKKVEGSAYSWWERSPDANYESYFCCVGDGGTTAHDHANYSMGVAFAFCF